LGEGLAPSAAATAANATAIALNEIKHSWQRWNYAGTGGDTAAEAETEVGQAMVQRC
jgi:hypothetical protein